jgi:hypothetical protein
MLKKALLGVLFLPALVVAQQQGPVRVDKPVICGPTELVLKNVVEYKELPIWGSQLEDSKIAIFANPETESWTMIQWSKDVACVIEAGEGYLLKDPMIAVDPKKFKG